MRGLSGVGGLRQRILCKQKVTCIYRVYLKVI